MSDQNKKSDGDGFELDWDDALSNWVWVTAFFSMRWMLSKSPITALSETVWVAMSTTIEAESCASSMCWVNWYL